MYVASSPALARFPKLVGTDEKYVPRSSFENHANAEELATYIFFDLSELSLTCTFHTFFGCCLRLKAAIPITLTNRRFGSFSNRL